MPYYIRPQPNSNLFSTAKMRSYLGEVGKGYLIQYSDFYLKIYPSQEQKGMLEIYRYRYNEDSPIKVELIKSDTLESWAKQFDSCS